MKRLVNLFIIVIGVMAITNGFAIAMMSGEESLSNTSVYNNNRSIEFSLTGQLIPTNSYIDMKIYDVMEAYGIQYDLAEGGSGIPATVNIIWFPYNSKFRYADRIKTVTLTEGITSTAINNFAAIIRMYAGTTSKRVTGSITVQPL